VLPRPILSALLLALSATTLFAQERADGTIGSIIRGIELHRHDVYDTTETTSWFPRLANSLHITTRPYVIQREFLFTPGQPYDSVLVAETGRNLRSLGLFRDVRIDSVHTDSGLVVRVVTQDGWTTRPAVNFRSVGGDVIVGLQFVEDNFLGTATRLGVGYTNDPDRNTLAFEFRQPRMIGRKIGLGLRYEDRSDGQVAFGVLEQPFYSIAGAFGFRLDGESRDETVYQYRDGSSDAVDSLTRRYAAVRGAVAWALRRPTRGYLRAGVSGQVRRDDYRPAEVDGNLSRTVTAALGPYAEISWARYQETEGFVTFSRTEDINLSTTFRLGAFVAPEALGYDRTGIGPLAGLRTGAVFPGGFLILDAIADGLYTSAGLDSGGVVLSGTLAWRTDSNSLLTLHSDGGWLKNPVPGEEFDIGLRNGPRAFGIHSFTGDQAFFTTAEYRRLVLPRVAGLFAVGLAGFVDYGGAWWRDEPRRTGTDVGVGLRLGFLRSPIGDLARIDLAWRFANDAKEEGLVLAIGKGFAFSLSATRPRR
jgi:outer membrane protein assembly factor BamA